MLHNGVWLIILYNVCNLYRIVCIFKFLHKPSVLLHSVCSFAHIYYLLCPINHDLRYFVAKFVCCNLRALRCKFFLPKSCLCKENDKYQVCFESLLISEREYLYIWPSKENFEGFFEGFSLLSPGLLELRAWPSSGLVWRRTSSHCTPFKVGFLRLMFNYVPFPFVFKFIFDFGPFKIHTIQGGVF